MAAEYKKRGGTYNTDPSEKEDSQKNLSKWTDEEWQTKEGSGNAKQDDGTRKRYLPKKAWDKMDDKEKQDTDKKKVEKSKTGKQFVGNTSKAKNARKEASDEKEDKDDAEGQEEQKDREEEQDDQEDEGGGEGVKDEEEKKTETGKKRGRPKASSIPNKKQKSDSENKSSSKKTFGKTMGSKHDSVDPPAKRASASRLPKKGQTVTWKAMPGWVEGTVVEIVEQNKTVEGNDPRIVLKSNGPSKKIAVHKPDAIYFD